MTTPKDLEEEQRAALAGEAPEQASDTTVSPLGGVFTRSLDGWGVDPLWLSRMAINDDRMLQQEGYAPDLQVFDELLDDDVAFSTFQQRRLDVISKDWEVEPGANDAASKAAADHLRAQLKKLRWDDVCDKMLHARWYGYGVGECLWQIGDDGLLELGGVYVPDRAWFGFTNAGELRLRTKDQPEGEAVPPHKFWTLQAGGTHDAQHYGLGLAHWCYWPIYFKKNAMRFWALFLEKFGMPTILAKFPTGWESDEEKLSDLLAAAGAIGTDSAVTVPNDENLEIEAFESQRGGSGASSYTDFINMMNEAITRVVLTQTMTTTAQSSGIGSTQADVHESKGLAIAQADSDLLHETFNSGPAKWMTQWNFPGAAAPRVYRKLEDDDDLNTLAELDTKLHALGWERSEESVRETYGEGYQRREVQTPPAFNQLAGPQNPAGGSPANDDDPARQQALDFAAQFSARDPQPLYVSRPLENGQELLDWAAGQGFTDLVPVDELHVTIVYSKAAVDWFRLATDSWWTPERVEIEAGGPRAVEPLGDDGLVVLQIANYDLERRHKDLVEGGASHDFPDYWPHVTFANSMAGVNDLTKVEPYRGQLKFGVEKWEPLRDSTVLELDVPAVQFAAKELDAIDRLVGAMSKEGRDVVQGMVAPLREAFEGLDFTASPDALRVAALEALERMDTVEFAAVLADPMFAVRAAEESGEGAETVA